MAFLIRKINYNKWLSCKSLQKSEYHADAITVCTKTSDNTLSVWRVEDGALSSEVNKPVITAIATIMNKLDPLDLVLLEEDAFLHNGIKITESKGESKLDEINGMHRDLSEIDYDKLGFVAEKIVEALDIKGRYVRVMKDEVATLLFDHYGENLATCQLEEKLKGDVVKVIERRAKK